VEERFRGHDAGDPAYRRITVALFLAALATFAQLYSVQPLLPELAAQFRVSATASTLALSLSTGALAVMLLLVGPLSDVAGRTRLIHVSLVVSAAVGVLVAVAPTWEALLVLRTVQGVLLAGLPAVGMAYLREEIHHGAHARAAGLYVAGTAMGGMSGRLLAGALADLWHWRASIGGIAALGLVSALAVRLLLPASRNFTPTPPQVRTLLSVTGAVLRDPALLALYGIAATFMGSFVAVYNAISFRLVGPPYHLSLAVTGLVFLVYPLGALSSTWAGSAASRHGRRTVLPVCGVITLLGLLLTLARPLPVVVLGLAVMTVGFFATHGVASGWVPTRAEMGPGGTGQAAAIYVFAYYLGSSVFGSLAGQAWSAGGWPAVVALAGVLILIGIGLTVVLHRTRSLIPEPGDEPDEAGPSTVAG
jgi:YNFM family putative membrane transporter